MVRRKKSPYIVAGVVSFVIFILGFLVGFTMLDVQLEDLRLEMDRNELELKNINLELTLLDKLGDGEKLCSYLNERIEYIDKKTWELGNKIVNPEGINQQYFDILARRYSVSLIEDWIFSNELSERCDTNRVSVLYFFEKNSDLCQSQGYVLDYLVEKDKENNLRIFALDKDLDEPAIQILVQAYDIEKAPTIVVEGNRFEDFRTKEELMVIFCAVNKNLSFCE
ncbi:MAG: hypothetical protein JW754_01715 [Candidatus Aenigmarchaeota archaeon]|nr:hypothetical protein [Candidatus Aenigmarchaeota archaeon]